MTSSPIGLVAFLLKKQFKWVDLDWANSPIAARFDFYYDFE